MSGASQQQRSEQAYRSPTDNRDISQVNPPPSGASRPVRRRYPEILDVDKTIQ